MGNVKSIRRNKILKPAIVYNGYERVCLTKNKKAKCFRVNRLVAETFIPNPNNYPQVNHKNEIKTDNRADNLEWCSSSYNINYGDRNNKAGKKISIKISMWRKEKGSDYSPRERRRVAQYTLDNKFVREFRSINEAGRETNSSIGTIHKCCVGTSHTCNGYKWRFVLDKGE